MAETNAVKVMSKPAWVKHIRNDAKTDWKPCQLWTPFWNADNTAQNTGGINTTQ